MTTVDPKRTGVKAREVPDFPNPVDEHARYFGEPGDMVRSQKFDGSGLYGFDVACPGCGQFGTVPVWPNEPKGWTVTGGSTDDVTTLSLTPSILKHCCGWHGHLKGGVFESC